MFVKEFILVAVLAAATSVQGNASGAPASACGDMIPQHHVAPQTSPFPYSLKVSKKGIKGGEKVTVTIAGGGKVKDFKGFFVQARVGDEPVGKFEAKPGVVKLVSCGSGSENGATHEKAETRKEVVLTWVAPPGLSETVRFRVTVAQNGGVFWVGHLSAPLHVKSS